jgi:hypothetical protein
MLSRLTKNNFPALIFQKLYHLPILLFTHCAYISVYQMGSVRAMLSGAHQTSRYVVYACTIADDNKIVEKSKNALLLFYVKIFVLRPFLCRNLFR